MDLGSFLIVLALAILTVAYIVKPIVEHVEIGISEEGRRLSMLQAERERVMGAIQELDMDNAMGKLLQEDYDSQRKLLVSHGVEILKAIDGIGGLEAAQSGVMDLEIEVEAAVARLRGTSGDISTGECASCGGPVTKIDRYCPRCGAELHSEKKA